ncbi:MAG: DUF1428 family protein [Bacteriovorax sp.]|nr:DUF1428 family protein [Bacteriovorax sp.]
MFTSLYFYRVPKKNVDLFLNIQKKSSEIYKKYGAIDDWTFGPDNLKEKYGCSSFLKEISLLPNEELFFSLSLFETKDEHDRIIALIDSDKEISNLYEKISELIDISKVVRGEFNRLI